ncbi:replication restart helicase PriA [Candidatus Deianiraea vastatrix]|uniref:Replication restart protein PriA n=1 Tax=Candidatus Deianiraea vastatrix TaxID=2163644 RepID=A0A5B8XG08_9RICK|nr:primosomal protein N' [Candidatus Deianiraea vastatrix]QED23181.1 Primosomal protein N' [Candidatus Deianiraea vastatrix]
MQIYYYQIAIAAPFDKLLTYKISEKMPIGSIVLCKIMSRTEYGVIMSEILPQNIDFDLAKIKEIHEKTPLVIDEKMLSFIHQLASYNMQKIGEVIDAFMTNYEILHKGFAISSKIKKDKIPAIKTIELSDKQREISDNIIADCDKFSTHVIDGVTGSGKTMIYLSVIEKILKNNSVDNLANGEKNNSDNANSDADLSQYSTRKCDSAACEKISQDGHHPCSNKANNKQNSQILIMLPEISLTPQTSSFFEEKLGIKPLLWHSNITKAKKRDILREIMSGDARVIVGTRSAILLPFVNLKMIIIDEEHDSSYKQSEKMIYSARDMAIMRAKILDIPAILLSATLCLETHFNAKSGKYRLHSINERYTKVKMPEIIVVDMTKKEEKPRSGECISARVLQIAKDVIESGKQVLFFLNRRGFSTSVMCGACNEFLGCENCSVNMAFHESKNLAICHYCGYTSQIPNDCKACKDVDKWVKIGFGVERVALELKKHFPSAKQQIFSSDEVDKASIDGILDDINSGKTQIIIGTQMISKGYNFPHLKCVVIVDTDTGFLDGDFRLYEKTYQMITQVAGRAGRFDERGLVLIQSYQQNNPAIMAIASMNKAKFYDDELRRRDSKYNPLPPLYRQIAIIISSNNEDLASNIAKNMMKHLYDNISHIARIFGPAPSLIKRINRQFRFRILISFAKKQGFMQEIYDTISKFQAKCDVMIKVDVDPLNFL